MAELNFELTGRKSDGHYSLMATGTGYEELSKRLSSPEGHQWIRSVFTWQWRFEQGDNLHIENGDGEVFVTLPQDNIPNFNGVSRHFIEGRLLTGNITIAHDDPRDIFIISIPQKENPELFEDSKRIFETPLYAHCGWGDNEDFLAYARAVHQQLEMPREVTICKDGRARASPTVLFKMSSDVSNSVGWALLRGAILGAHLKLP